jgi:hypothetical protein
MSYSFTRTREQLMTMILNKVILLGSETATADDATLVYESIDLRLKEMHRLGIFWRNVNKQPLSFTIQASTTSASASADVLFPIQMTVTDISVDKEVRIISIQEYAGIEDKAESGVPTKVLWAGSAEFIFHPVPTATTTAKLTYESIADDTAANTAIDIDVSMLRWIRDIIAYDIGDYFGIPEQKMNRWMQEAMVAERNIRKLGVQHTDLVTVQVDEFNGSRKKDYA